MTYIILGIFAATAAVGGFRSLFSRTGSNGILAAILLSVSMLFTILPPVRLSSVAYMSLGGALLFVMAVLAVFRSGSVGGWLYAVYMSFLLGLTFYAVERWVQGYELTQLTRSNVLLYALFVLGVSLFSANPKYAFPIAVLSANVSSFTWWLAEGGVYQLFGTSYDKAVILFVFSAVIANYVTAFAMKLFPKPKEIFVEMSDEIEPETKGKVKK